MSVLAARLGLTLDKCDEYGNRAGFRETDHYRRTQILKRSGGHRQLSVPSPDLARVQRIILRDILDELCPHPAAMAFRRGSSVATNARCHSGRGVIVRLDLKDFFPSIRYAAVASVFRDLGFNSHETALLTDPSTQWAEGNGARTSRKSRQLPQGACSSPALANLASRRMDERLTVIASQLGYRYTRYADDLCFSHADWKQDVLPLVMQVGKTVEVSGHRINERKTMIMRPHQRQVVTGLVVNAAPDALGTGTGPRVSRRDVRGFRAFLHQTRRDGWAEASERLGLDARLYALGFIAYVHMVDPQQAIRLRSQLPAA